MCDGATYTRWIARTSSFPALERVLYAIPILDLSQRKALLLACRAQYPPNPGSRVYLNQKEIWLSPVYLDYLHTPPAERGLLRHRQSISLRSLISGADEVFSSPIYTGFLSSVIRSAPIQDPTSFLDSVEKGVHKELEASVIEYRPSRLDFRSIFGTASDRMIPISPNIDPCPRVADGIHRNLLRARESFQDMILYPRCGNKTVGSEVEREFWRQTPPDMYCEMWEEAQLHGGVTTVMLQRLSFWRGVSVPGPVEVRTAWKYNDLKPRVYFAQGGDTFTTSRYIQHIFNLLVDCLEGTHRRNRFNPITGILTEDDTMIIYDYQSFTSLLDAIRDFLKELADFLGGVTVHLVGDKDGIQSIDLGDLMRRYTQDCVMFAEFE